MYEIGAGTGTWRISQKRKAMLGISDLNVRPNSVCSDKLHSILDVNTHPSSALAKRDHVLCSIYEKQDPITEPDATRILLN